MIFDKLFCVNYPSGSFGHFTHLILASAGTEFHKVDVEHKFNNQINSGSSHFIHSEVRKLCCNEYCPEDYSVYATTDLINDYKRLTDNGKYTSVIVDPGINDDSINFSSFFPGAPIIRIYYDDFSWPLSLYVFYARCMSEVTYRETHISNFIIPEEDIWGTNEDWVHREKYFLMLKEHKFRHMWKPLLGAININVDCYTNYDKLFHSFSKSLSIENFEDLYNKFFQSNKHHLEWYIQSRLVLEAIKEHRNIDLSILSKNLYAQATINYYIYLLYGFDVPAWDCRDWFTSTEDIFKLLRKHNIDNV